VWTVLLWLTVWMALMALWACYWMVFTLVGGSGGWPCCYCPAASGRLVDEDGGNSFVVCWCRGERLVMKGNGWDVVVL
jgi:hypothetical protein